MQVKWLDTVLELSKPEGVAVWLVAELVLWSKLEDVAVTDLQVSVGFVDVT